MEHHQTSLILIGHGSTQNASSREPVYLHAEALRRRGRFREVLEAFCVQPPFIEEVLARATGARVYALPLFISHGYFTTEVIPRRLGLPRRGPEASNQWARRGEGWLHYGAPLGDHPSMTRVVLGRARTIVEQHPGPVPADPAQSALVLVGHGTERHGGSRAAILEQVTRIRSRGLYREVEGVFIEESPRVPEVFGLVQSSSLVVVPFFISDGMHTLEDIPRLLGETEEVVERRVAASEPTWVNPTCRQGKWVWYSGAVGTGPELVAVILEQLQASAPAPDSGMAPADDQPCREGRGSV